eukprot:scaffold208973_cov19-Tisochrysis_lutea.AAC.1
MKLIHSCSLADVPGCNLNDSGYLRFEEKAHNRVGKEIRSSKQSISSGKRAGGLVLFFFLPNLCQSFDDYAQRYRLRKWL